MGFFQGCQACASGKKQTANPHERGTEAHRNWDAGWLDEFRRLPIELRTSRLPTENEHVDS